MDRPIIKYFLFFLMIRSHTHTLHRLIESTAKQRLSDAWWWDGNAAVLGGTSPIRIGFFDADLDLMSVCLCYGDLIAELSILYVCAFVGEVY